MMMMMMGMMVWSGLERRRSVLLDRTRECMYSTVHRQWAWFETEKAFFRISWNFDCLLACLLTCSSWDFVLFNVEC